jgi:S1-C subfamily serine protease
MDPSIASAPERRPFAPSSSSAWYRLPLLLLVLLILSAVAFLPTYLEQIKYKQTKGEVAALAESLPDLKVGSLGKLFTLVGRVAAPSVVHINTEQSVGRRDEFNALLEPRLRQQLGQASGVIVDAEGYIVTNYHVIVSADDIQVKLADGRTFVAEVVGDDARNDLAVLKINADKLIPAPWGDSDQLQVGEMVWALGNPFGLDNSLTFGIVSAKARRVPIARDRYSEYLQTDTAVNPGNSGGPLVNMKGEVVGINTAIVGPTFQGISFAIPSNMVRRVYEKIKQTGSIANGFLGVDLMNLDPLLAQRLGIDQFEGALVRGVVIGSPAEKAGVEPGDFIVAWNGEKLADAQQLSQNIADTAPGTQANMTVIRNGEEIKLEVTVGRRPPRNR